MPCLVQLCSISFSLSLFFLRFFLLSLSISLYFCSLFFISFFLISFSVAISLYCSISSILYYIYVYFSLTFYYLCSYFNLENISIFSVFCFDSLLCLLTSPQEKRGNRESEINLIALRICLMAETFEKKTNILRAHRNETQNCCSVDEEKVF